MNYLNSKNSIITLVIGMTAVCWIENAQATNTSSIKQLREEQEIKSISVRSNSAQEAQYLATKSESELNEGRDVIKVKHKHLLFLNMSKVALKNDYEEEIDLIKKENPELFSFFYTSAQMKEFKRMTSEEINAHFKSYAETYYRTSGFNYYSYYLVPSYKAEKEKLVQYAFVVKNIKFPNKGDVIKDSVSRFDLSYEIAEAAYNKNMKENTN